MKALILAGGHGTRMREETEFRPKPMVEIGGRPILWHVMKHLSCYGVNEFVVAVGYKGDMVKDYFLNYDTRNNDFTLRLGSESSLEIHGQHDEGAWSVTVVDTGQETLTGGRILRSAKYLEGAPFLVTYGDGVSDVDVSLLVNHHRSSGKLATVTVTQPPSRFGVAELDDQGVRRFQEKPRLDGWVNIGYFVLEPKALGFVDEGPLEHQAVNSLAAQRELGAYRHNGFWQPMDTHKEAMLLNDLWDSGSPPWRVW